ncbi:MAG: hypothetical protein IPJ77_11930 [Planctomycetes bacterium]|nr:hypothetical protein [Planctomycetota bacterium]
MSSLIGIPGERWSLARATDAMGSAARQVGRPGLVWLCGFFFPALTFMGGNGGELLLGLLFRGTSGVSRGGELIIGAGVLLAMLGPRMTAGLARLGSPEAWSEETRTRRTPRVRDVWRAGKGLAWSTLGLWFLVLLMLAVPSLVVLAPPLYLLEHWGLTPGTGDEDTNALCALVLGPFVAVVLVMGFVLSVLYQLALQSLVHNQRGTASALLHAWRIARNDAWATARAVLVDFLAFLTLLVVQLAAVVVFAFSLASVCCLAPALLLLLFVRKPWVVRTLEILYASMLLLLPGFIGVVRAAYWARVYRSLGGLSPDDGVPGLQPGAESARIARA